MLRKVLTCLALISANFSFGQEKPIIPPAPNAVNLAYNTEISMGLYTGTPQISIPVWTVNAGALQLPISLSYTSGGVKVADMASWCGLGWNLNAGGVVTRSVLGLPDETPTFGYIEYNVPPMTNENQPAYVAMADGGIDSQQDLFFFNMPGGSGRFVFDKTGTPQLIPKKNYKITKGSIAGYQFSEPSGNAYCISEWEIVDDKGIIYRFKDYEKTGASSRNIGGSAGGFSSRNINSWYLTEMEAPTGEKIVFNYATVDLSYDLAPGKTFNIRLSGTCDYPANTSIQRQFINTKRLTSIEFPDGKIRFVPTAMGRADFVGDHALDKIIIENKQGHIKKQFKLDYKYLVGNSLMDYTSINPAGENNFFVASTLTPSPSFNRRLMLMKCTEQDANGVALNNGQSFDYHTSIGLPNRASEFADHWGFANKADEPLSEAPYVLINPSQMGSPSPEVYIGGKNVDFQYAKEGSLYKINHSTGGSTEYEFESNDAGPSPFIPRKVTKSPAIHSVGISHYNYNVDGWYDQYNYVMRPDGNGNTVRNYYVEFSVATNSTSTAQVQLADIPYYPSSGLNFYIENVVSNSVLWRGYSDGTYNVNLPAGVYRLYHCPSYALLNSPQNPDQQKQHTATITGLYEITSEEGTQGQPPKVGGIRVKKEKQYDPVSQQTLYKTYKYVLDGSSGQLLSAPVYKYEFDVKDNNNLGNPCKYIGVSFNSVNSLSTTHNSYVGYQFVEEQAVSASGEPLGKTEYSFTGPNESPDLLFRNTGEASGFTYYDAANPPADRRDWLRGFLVQRQDYEYKNLAYTPVRKIVNVYNKTLAPASNGIQVNVQTRNLSNGLHDLTVIQYSHYSGTIFLEQTEETLYNGSASIKTTTTIENSVKSLLPVSKTFAKSDGSLSKEQYTYPKEYAAGNAAIDNLVNRNIVSVPIETVKLKVQPAGSVSITGGTLTNYYPTGGGKIQSVSLLETNTAIPLSSFKFSNAPSGQLPTSLNASVFAADTRYQPSALFNSYDANGNVTEMQKVNHPKEVYLWGYNGVYPVAKVIGSDYTTVSGIINQSILDNANGQYNDQQIRDELNKIRTWFSGNQHVSVTTYTYSPLLGMTSQSDANNRTTYYEYDSFGRLILVRDQNNMILKKICYNYAGQPGNCLP
ncbi:hypothetical protein EGT74_15380 [Chitinophaga lutea]|uniref:RHS repeat protein n=1 Tax=Chitinophaga lutea TaxID=2488634 RepID=A0A3N4PP41_9BACT|nr:RHS repeat protein [Chitinophaga lutea]RPE08429.1 hypothetical protein EGT74_15380 [Chitinophaga lutea]